MGDDGADNFEQPEEKFVRMSSQEHAHNGPAKFSRRVLSLGVVLTVICAVVGSAVGDYLAGRDIDRDIINWVGLPGDLFVRALQCVALPLVAVKVVLAVFHLMAVGKAGRVAKYTVGVYLLTTFIAVLEGLAAVAIFDNGFRQINIGFSPTFVRILCPNEDSMLTQSGEKVLCTNTSDIPPNSDQADFTIDNVNNFFETRDLRGDAFSPLSFSEILQEGIFRKLVSDNIVAEFANEGIGGIAVFAIVLGAASWKLERRPVLFIDFLKDINDILVKIVQWLIYVTPLAIFSLVMQAYAGSENVKLSFQGLERFGYAVGLAMTVHLLVVYPVLVLVFTRTNPCTYLIYIIPAQIVAFASGSSVATLPVTLRCVKETGKVHDSVNHFVIPLGTALNVDGTALYLPPAIIFLAITLGFEVDSIAYVLIILVSTIGSAAAASVPNAGLVLIFTAFNTAFGNTGTPDSYIFLVFIEWLMARYRTMLNVTGDAVVARIVTHLAGLVVKENQPAVVLEVD